MQRSVETAASSSAWYCTAQRRQVRADCDGPKRLSAWSFTSTFAADNGGRHEFTTMWVQPRQHAQRSLRVMKLSPTYPWPLWLCRLGFGRAHLCFRRTCTRVPILSWAGLPQSSRHRPESTRTAMWLSSVLMLPSLSVQGCCRQGACLLPNDQHQGLPVHGAPNWPCGVLCTNRAASSWLQPQPATCRCVEAAATATPAHEVSPCTACEPQLPFRLASPLPTGGPHVVGAALRGHQLPGLRHW